MMATSTGLECKLLDRLCVIAVEGVGFGEPSAPALIESLKRIAHRFCYGKGDRMLFAIHALRYLCACQKDRSSDEMLNWLQRAVDEGGLRPEIADYALDMHTARGRAMGRDLRHFLTVGAQIHPGWSLLDRSHLEKLLRQIEGLSL